MSKQKRRPLSAKERCRIVFRSEGCCYYCGAHLDFADDGGIATHFDHVIPLARGGLDDPSNIVASCSQCNAKKHIMTGFEFIAHTMGFEIPVWTYLNPDWEEIDWVDHPDFLAGINDGDGESGEEYAFDHEMDDDFDDDIEEDNWVPLGAALANSITSIAEAFGGKE